MTDVPQLPAIPVELYETFTTDENGTRIALRFEDGTRLSIDFGPESPEAEEFLHLLTRIVNDRLRRIASRGVEITDFVPPEGGDRQ